jgi:segregation and condensation protein B
MSDIEADLPDLLIERDERRRWLRAVEALLFASAEPLTEADLRRRIPDEVDLGAVLEELAEFYAERGVTLVHSGDRWAFRTAPDLAPLLRTEKPTRRKLSRAAMETLAIIAYHQPVTRAEIEEIRGVALSKGTMDTLLEAGWIRPGRRRDTPGRPLTWVTTSAFLDQFGLEDLKSLPGLEDLKAAGLLERRVGLTSIAMQEDDLLEGDVDEDDEDDQLDFLPDDDTLDDYAPQNSAGEDEDPPKP